MRVREPAPPSRPFPGAALPLERFRLSASFLGLVVYLWVIHSAKAPIASYAIGLGLFGLLLQSHRLRLPAPLLWFGAFILWAAISSAIATGAYFDGDRVTDYVKLWLIFLVAANVAENRRQLELLTVAWLAIFALYPVRGTLFNFAFGIGDFGRYAWNHSFSNPNDLAGLTLPMLALSVAVLQGSVKRSWVRFSALAGVVILPALIVITQSRGGILALATVGLLIIAQYRRQARGLAIGVLAAGVVFLAAPPEVWDRLGGLINAGDTTMLREVDEEGSAEQRFEIWRVALAISADHPVAGVGLGRYQEAHAEYAALSQFKPTAWGRRDTHSIYLNILAETGIPGLLLFICMVGAVLVRGYRLARRLQSIDPTASRQITTLSIGLVGFLQAGLFGTFHRVAFLYVYLGIIAAASTILGREAESQSVGIQGARSRQTRAAPRVQRAVR